MKKIYAILVAAVMSVSLFAAPSQADLASYLEEGYYVACFQAPADATCKDIYWMGEYCGWTITTPLDELVKCEALTGANAGWYVAKVPVVEGKSNDGKPIQLNECGKLTWDVQPSNEPIEVLDGTVTVDSKDNGESDLKGFGTDKAAIFTITSWKGGYNPCNKVCDEQVYTIRIYAPYCEYLDGVEPTIKGSFNSWGDAITMEFKDTYYEYVTPAVTANFEFKFNNDPAGSWTHEFVHFNEDGTTSGVPASGNISLTNGTEFYTYDATNRILTFDFADDTKFQYAGCEPSEEYAVKAKLPTLNCPESVEIVGSFGEGWDKGVAMTFNGSTGYFEATINATSDAEFQFRGAGSWDVVLQVPDAEKEGEWKGSSNLKLSDWAVDGVIELDLSDPAEYRWTPAAQGIEEVVLTEKAHKVVVDGVLYIVRDNKMFNVQGAQVR